MTNHGIPFYGERGTWFTTEDVARILLELHGLKVFDCEACEMSGVERATRAYHEPHDCKVCDGRGQYIGNHPDAP